MVICTHTVNMEYVLVLEHYHYSNSFTQYCKFVNIDRGENFGESCYECCQQVCPVGLLGQTEHRYIPLYITPLRKLAILDQGIHICS